MNEVSPQPKDEYMRYRSSTMIFGIPSILLMIGASLFILASIILGDTESKIGAILFIIAFIALGVYRVLRLAIKVESSSDGLKLSYLLLKPKYIPWQDIHEVRLKLSRGQWCVIEYGENPVKKVSFIVDYMSRYARSERDRLLTVIVNRAQLQRVGKKHWGSHVDKYN